MAGLWNRKFDYTNGETRQCKGCDTTFHTYKPRWRCRNCANEKQRVAETIKRSKYQKKDTYPFNNKTNEAGNRFCSIRTAISNAWKEYKKTGDKSVITQHYDKQIKEIEENGIMIWILDRRDKETLNAKKVKSKKNIQRDYPNHHDYYEY
jgi:rubredoxin